MSKKSQYQNVFWYKRTSRWIVKIHSNGGLPSERTIHLGYFKPDDEESAARVADVAKRLLDRVGLLRKWDGQFNLDGNPPSSVPISKILQMLLAKKVITPEQAREIITPHG